MLNAINHQTSHQDCGLFQDMPDLLSGSTQEQLEVLFSKHQILEVLHHEFTEAGFPAEIEREGLPVEFGIELLVQMQLHKRTQPNVLVGILRRHFENEEDPAQACADMIYKAVEADLVDWVSDPAQLIVRWEISQDIQDRLDVLQYPLPMIEKPETVTNNRETGYLSIRSSVILKKNHTDDDVCLDHLNRSNSVPLSINEDVLQFTVNKWRNMDRQKDDESYRDFKKRQKTFRKYDRVSRDVIAAVLVHGNRFWLTHRYDKRGRSYCQGYHVNYQGNDWNKACVQLGEDFAEPLNDA